MMTSATMTHTMYQAEIQTPSFQRIRTNDWEDITIKYVEPPTPPNTPVNYFNVLHAYPAIKDPNPTPELPTKQIETKPINPNNDNGEVTSTEMATPKSTDMYMGMSPFDVEFTLNLIESP
jgi:hypothetical protein